MRSQQSEGCAVQPVARHHQSTWTIDLHHDVAVTSLIPSLSCRSCRPNDPFAELPRLSKTSIADEVYMERVAANFGLEVSEVDAQTGHGEFIAAQIRDGFDAEKKGYEQIASEE